MLEWIRLPPTSTPDEVLLRVADRQLKPMAWADLNSRPNDVVTALALHPNDAWLVSITVPPLSGERREQAIASQLEALLPGALEDYVWRVGASLNQPQHVAVARRTALEFWQARCHASKLRAVTGLWPAAASLGTGPITAHFHRWPGAWFWQTQRAPLSLLPWGGALPTELLGATRPVAWTADAGADAPPDGLEVARVPLAAQSVPADESLSFPADRRTSGSARSRRYIIALTGVLASIWLGGWQLQLAQLRQDIEVLQDAIESQFRSAFPQIPVILDPVAQAQRALDNEAEAVVLDLPLDQFMNLAALAPSLSGRVSEFEFDRTGITLRIDDETPAEELIQLSSTLGWRVAQDPSAPLQWRVNWSEQSP